MYAATPTDKEGLGGTRVRVSTRVDKWLLTSSCLSPLTYQTDYPRLSGVSRSHPHAKGSDIMQVIASRQRTVSLPNGRLVITAQLEHLQGNAQAHFSVTAEEYEGRKREPVSCGCLHDMILQHAPEFAPAVALHLSDADGAPMHAEANGWYWAGGHAEYRREGVPGQPAIPNTAILATHLRVSQDEAQRLILAVLAGLMSKSQFGEYVAQQRDRWRREAGEVLVWLTEPAKATA